MQTAHPFLSKKALLLDNKYGRASTSGSFLASSAEVHLHLLESHTGCQLSHRGVLVGTQGMWNNAKSGSLGLRRLLLQFSW